jgi:hypothetical protein
MDRRYFNGLPSVTWHVLPPNATSNDAHASGAAPGVISCMYVVLVPKTGQRSKLELWADSLGRQYAASESMQLIVDGVTP